MSGVSPYVLKWNEGFLVVGTQFAGGVFLGTAMMHFLSDANETFGDLTTKEYPFAFMLACAGYLMTMLADSVISSILEKAGRDGDAGDVEIQGSYFAFCFCRKCDSVSIATTISFFTLLNHVFFQGITVFFFYQKVG